MLPKRHTHKKKRKRRKNAGNAEFTAKQIF
jgi:hypothetical protein